MKKLLLIIFGGFFIFGSCRKPKTEKPYVPITRCADMTRSIDTINMYIQGNWEWMEEYRITRYNGEELITPNTPGQRRLFWSFSGDIAKLHFENESDSIYRFKIQREYEITNYSTDSLPVLTFYRLNDGLRVSYVPVKICRNQLLTQNQYISSNGGESLWVRK